MKKTLVTLVAAIFGLTSMAFAADSEVSSPDVTASKSVVVKKAKKNKNKKKKKAKKHNHEAEAPAAPAAPAEPAPDAMPAAPAEGHGQ